MTRDKVLALAIAVATFGVVTGAITGVGLATADTARAQPAAVASLAGDWKGGYISSGGADVNSFDVKLKQTGANITGTITETNAFGDTSQAMFLTSTFTGTVRAGAVNFTKTYDGSGGASHSVIYQGRLDATGRRVRGTFNAAGNTGVFEMVR